MIYQCRDLIFPQGGAEGMGAVADPFGAMETGADGLMSVQFGVAEEEEDLAEEVKDTEWILVEWR